VNGTLEWSFRTDASISSDPAVTDGTIYFGSLDNQLYAVDTEGNERWKFQTGHRIVSDPVTANGMVFVGSSDRFVYAIDAATGGLVWRYETGDSVQAGPTYEDGVIHIGSRDNTLYSLVADTGQLRWNYTATDDPDITPVSISIKQTAAVTENRVFFGSTNTYFYALNRFDGTHQWSRETEQSINSAPALWNDTVYFASMLGTLYAMETKTGEIDGPPIDSTHPSMRTRLSTMAHYISATASVHFVLLTQGLGTTSGSSKPIIQSRQHHL
jgi:outer membrane protein assembly factor BamB